MWVARLTTIDVDAKMRHERRRVVAPNFVPAGKQTHGTLLLTAREQLLRAEVDELKVARKPNRVRERPRRRVALTRKPVPAWSTRPPRAGLVAMKKSVGG